MSTPNLKFELSPTESIAESFTSIPGQQYPSLFHPHSQHTIDQLQAMTPQSFDEDSLFGDDINGSLSGTPAPISSAPAPAPEKKPVKKRKSWGQQLPEPKTNLPPRKRAKTEDEKEQRRVERVLRNRRAAQSSRERKRQEVEALEAEKRQIERRNNDLELQLANMAAKCAALEQKLTEATGIPHGNLSSNFLPSAHSTPSRQQSFHNPSPIALTKDLFGEEPDPSMRQMMMETPTLTDTHNKIQSIMSPTVNPTVLLSPPIESMDESSFNASPFRSTQHSAAMLCDLQCQPKEQGPWMSSLQNFLTTRALAVLLWTQMSWRAISTVLDPLEQIRNSLMNGSRLSPTPSVMTLIIWLVTTTAPLTISSKLTLTPTTLHSQRPRFTLRIRLLRRLLACSPYLARPLLDATLKELRLSSEQRRSQDGLEGASFGTVCEGGGSWSGLESLMTLHWAIQVIMKEQEQEQGQGHAQTQMFSEPDAVMNVGQFMEQLNDLFDLREIKGLARKDPVNVTSMMGGVILGEKS